MQTKHNYTDKNVIDAFGASVEVDDRKMREHIKEAVDLGWNMVRTAERGKQMHDVMNGTNASPIHTTVEAAQHNRIVLHAVLCSMGGSEFDTGAQLREAIEAVDQLRADLVRLQELLPDETPRVTNIHRM